MTATAGKGLIEISMALIRSRILRWGLFFFPVVLYFWYIYAFGVDVIFWDEWNLIPMIHHSFLGSLTVTDLWEQHNENRMLIPNLYFLLLADVAHFDTKTGMFVGASFLIFSFALLFAIYRKYSPDRIWTFVPVGYLMFSLVQHENTLWGFQVAWYMILVCLLGMFACLDRTEKTAWSFALSVVLAILASFSSLQGLFLWPAGMVYLFANRYNVSYKLLWIFFFLATSLVYFVGFDFHNTGGAPVFGFLSHPDNAMVYFFVAIGSVLPVGSNGTKGWIGFILFLLSVYYAVRAVLSVKSDQAYLLPLALMSFVILFDFSLVVGRSGFGVGQATSSRYTVYNILLLIAIYISVARDVSKGLVGRKIILLPAVAVGIAVAVQIPSSFVDGLHEGVNLFEFRTKAAEVLFSYRTATPKRIENYLWSNEQLVIQRAALADRYRLSVFQKK